MKTFRNVNYTKRNYECTNIVACEAEQAPNANYEECGAEILNGLTRLHSENDVRYYGYL